MTMNINNIDKFYYCTWLHMQMVQEVPSIASPTMSLDAFFAPSIPDRLNGWKNGFNVCKQYRFNKPMSESEVSHQCCSKINCAAESCLTNNQYMPLSNERSTECSWIYEVMVSTGIKDKIGIGYVSAKIL